MSKGAVSLPLTYVYAVLIGIVVFIVATRVVGVQGEQANAQQEREILDYFDAIIDGFASDPNTIQNLSIDRLTVRFDWADGSRLRVGDRNVLLRVATFSERALSGTISAWTYPYGIESSSVPLLFLSNGSTDYGIISTDVGPRSALHDEKPFRAERYGLDLNPYEEAVDFPDGKRLCIKEPAHTEGWVGCHLRFVSEQAPYGYLSWSGHDRWYPVASEGALFAALFAADERSWNATMLDVYERDRITRDVLITRAERFEDLSDSMTLPDVLPDECKPTYAAAISALEDIQASQDPTNAADYIGIRTTEPTASFTDFDPIIAAIETIEDADSQLVRAGCPEVVG